MLKSLMEKREALMARFAKVEESQIQDAELRAKFRTLKGKQGGFTLLELLVVVAILAAIAGTATIALQDTDARAAAAAHVAMMDELNKGVRTYKVLNKEFPNDFDSLAYLPTSAATSTSADLLDDANGDNVWVEANDVTITGMENNVALFSISADMRQSLEDVGITTLRYINPGNAPEGTVAGTEDCTRTNIQSLISSRRNAVVAGNIFLPEAANGCGVSQTLEAGSNVAIWVGGNERVLGQGVGEFTYNGSAFSSADVGAPLFMAVGMGPGAELFNANSLGGMTSVPVYRHVSADQYNRFIALFQIGEFTDATTVQEPEQVTLAAVVDGAGDTKEEELGEWDGTRNTI